MHQPRDVLDRVDPVLLRRVVVGQHRDQVVLALPGERADAVDVPAGARRAASRSSRARSPRRARRPGYPTAATGSPGPSARAGRRARRPTARSSAGSSSSSSSISSCAVTWVSPQYPSWPSSVSFISRQVEEVLQPAHADLVPQVGRRVVVGLGDHQRRLVLLPGRQRRAGLLVPAQQGGQDDRLHDARRVEVPLAVGVSRRPRSPRRTRSPRGRPARPRSAPWMPADSFAASARYAAGAVQIPARHPGARRRPRRPRAARWPARSRAARRGRRAAGRPLPAGLITEAAVTPAAHASMTPDGKHGRGSRVRSASARPVHPLPRISARDGVRQR